VRPADEKQKHWSARKTCNDTRQISRENYFYYVLFLKKSSIKGERKMKIVLICNNSEFYY
jgi:hypothetical protein